jgi:hypothetical protein
VLFALTAAVATLVPAAGASAGTLDQQQTTSNFGCLAVSATGSSGQTFTAGLTGQLDQVDLALNGLFNPTTPLTVQIRDGSASGPGGTVLATASVPTSSVTSSESWVPVAFTALAPVTAGTQYSIVAFAGATGWAWCSGQAAPDSAYLGGKLYSSPDDTGPGSGPWFEGNPNSDFEFKTYVAPPPSTGGGDPSTTTPPPVKKKCKKKKAKKRGAATAKKKCKKKKR